MYIRQPKEISDIAQYFLVPGNTTHRQYEALRAFFVEGLPSAETAQRFGYTKGSFQVLCSKFRKNPHRNFFATPSKGPKSTPKRDSLHDDVIKLRKQNLSVYDISEALKKEGNRLSPAAIDKILKKEGFARLPKRPADERPNRARPTAADIADVRELDLTPRQFRTRFGGLFLFVPYLAEAGLNRMLRQADFPGTKMIPAQNAILSHLGLKLFGNARHSHVMSHVFDEGLALFAGINVIPKRSFLTEYSCRIAPEVYPAFMKSWFKAMGKIGLERGTSFDLDFHTIPFHGEDALVEKHYVSKRSRKQKGVLAFLAQDDEKRVFCYANADLRKEEQNDEVLRFIDFWKQQTGRLPEELVFDSKLTTYANLNLINKKKIPFITLRRRSKEMVKEILLKPASAWRRIELKGISRVYRTPRIIDEKISLKGYEGPLRQLTIIDLGHEEPTLLITNQLKRSPASLIKRYAERMIIENGIADGIDFFHMDALSSAVAMKVSLDLQLTLMASSLYRLLGDRIGNGYETAKSRHIFRDFIEASASVLIEGKKINVRFQKRAHNPLLLAAGFQETNIRVPWLGGKHLTLTFG